jgi:hypothetical protein
VYNGKFDCRVTVRCPFCEKTTQKEMNYRYENLIVDKYQYKIIDSFNCSFCRKIAFKESRTDILSPESIKEKEVGRVG